MFICELRIENFRMFGEGTEEFVLPLEPGLTALVGENDNGKTAVIDALRLVLGTRDQESFRIKQHYVAMTRPTHLLCLAIKGSTFSPTELDLLRARGWRLALVGTSGTTWI
jgi:predicted ATP-dependent endonuclease of OLD family